MTRTPLRIALLTVAVVAMLAVPNALAGKGGKPGGGGGGGGNTTSGSSSLGLVLMDGATQAAHMGRVTFNVATSATSRPFVGVRCYQGTAFVYDGYVGYFADYLYDPWFVLDSPYWTDGVAANCTARLFYYDKRGNQIVLSTLGFPVAA